MLINNITATVVTFIIKKQSPIHLGKFQNLCSSHLYIDHLQKMFRFGERIKFCHLSQEKVGEPIAVSSPSARSESLGQRSQRPCFWRNLVLGCWERGRPEWALLWWAGLEWGVGMGRRPCPVRGLSLLCVVETAAVPVLIRGDLPICFCFSLSSSFKPTVKILIEQQSKPWSEMDDQQSLHPPLLEAPSEAVLGEKEVGSGGAGVSALPHSAAPKCTGLPSYSSACWWGLLMTSYKSTENISPALLTISSQKGLPEHMSSWPCSLKDFFFLTYSLKGRKLLWPIVKKQKVIFITILSQSRDPKILLNASRELPMLTCYVEPKFSASTKNNKKG